MEISVDSIVNAITSLVNTIQANLSMVVTTAIIGIVSGWIASNILQGKSLGILGNLVVGILGAFVGTYLFGLMNIHVTTTAIPVNDVIAAVVGAMVLLVVWRLVKKK